MIKLFKKQCSSNCKYHKGFSLVEVLLAVVLLAIIITPIMQVLYTSLTLNQKSRILMGATDCGQSLMEYMESMTSEEIKAKFEVSDGTNIHLDCIGYDGVVRKVASYSNSMTSPYSNISDVHYQYARWAGLHYYTSIQTGNTKPYITYVDDTNTYYAFNNINVNGYYYTAVVYIEPNASFSSETYTVEDVRIDVYYIDQKKDMYSRYAMEDYLVSLNGSVFNKTAG